MIRLIPQARLVALVIATGLGACGGTADATIEHEVSLLVGEAGRLADVAEVRLVARGHRAILFLETGLYEADPRGRRRVIRALAKIGHQDALPILAHLVARDPDEEVREVAAKAQRALEGSAGIPGDELKN